MLEIILFGLCRNQIVICVMLLFCKKNVLSRDEQKLNPIFRLFNFEVWDLVFWCKLRRGRCGFEVNGEMCVSFVNVNLLLSVFLPDF